MSRRLPSLLPIAIVLVALFAAPVFGRQWEYKNKHFEAEIAHFDSGILWLVKPDGAKVGFRRHEMTPADREFADAWLAKHEGGPIGETIEVSATGFREVIRYPDNAHPPEPVITAVLRFRGRPAATATQFHGLKFHAETDDGRKPELTPYNSMGVTGGGDVQISRGKMYYEPDWGFRARIQWREPPTSFKTFRNLQGSLIVTTGRPESFVVDGIDFKPDRKIEHRLLTQAGLEVTLNPSGLSAGATFGDGKQPPQMKVFFNGARHQVYAVELIDRRDEPLERNPLVFGSSVVDNATGGKTAESSTYQFVLDDPPPTDLRLKITVLLDVREIPVTFEIKDLEFSPKL